MSFEDIDTLEARDGGGNPLALVPRNQLPPAAISGSLLHSRRHSGNHLGDSAMA
jgi:hypothetical protein